MRSLGFVCCAALAFLVYAKVSERYPVSLLQAGSEAARYIIKTKEGEGRLLIESLDARTGARADLSDVSISAAIRRPSILQGLRVEETGNGTYSIKGRSRCFELEPGCFRIEQIQGKETINVASQL